MVYSELLIWRDGGTLLQLLRRATQALVFDPRHASNALSAARAPSSNMRASSWPHDSSAPSSDLFAAPAMCSMVV